MTGSLVWYFTQATGAASAALVSGEKIEDVALRVDHLSIGARILARDLRSGSAKDWQDINSRLTAFRSGLLAVYFALPYDEGY